MPIDQYIMIMINIKSISALCARVDIDSQRELAVRAGLHPTTLSKILKNQRNVTLKTVERLCGVLDCQPGAFLEYRPY